MTDSPADSATPEIGPHQHSVRISTGSRLHFGLLDTAEPFGGVGVMLDRPATEVIASPSDRFICDDRSAPRIGAIAERIAKHSQLPGLPHCRVTVTRRAAAHCGLGSGTQLALATAEAICCFLGIAIEPVVLATRIAGRGQRSAVGVHGYFSGGLIYETAQKRCELNPLRERIELPAHWCVGLFQPARQVQSISGEFEHEQFANLSPAGAETRSALQRTVTRDILPAARQGDFAAFTASVHKYNQESGKLFESVQGGPYNGAAVSEVIDRMVRHGAQGVGQSSWGPGVFAWFDSMTKAETFASCLPNGFKLIVIAQPRNQSRAVHEIS
jgi:beta-RFAP synthase